MGYSREVYDSAMEVLGQRRRKAEQEVAQRRMAFYANCPRGQQIQQELAAVGSSAARRVFAGGNVAAEIAKLREQSLALQKERRQLLEQVGLAEDALEAHYQCQACEDTGYIDGKMCNCLKGLLRQEAYRRLNAMTPLTLSGFEQFELRYYSSRAEAGEVSPREHMKGVLEFCQNYASSFCSHSPSLLFQGRTGLGKTHLSLSIAKTAIDKGYGVVYGSVQNFLSVLEKERFGRLESDTNRDLLHCDLLILDDLGTEFSTQFVSAALYNIINTRLMSEKPTIISTNLSMKELLERYGERMVSRMIGGYQRLMFAGKDVRQIRYLEQERGTKITEM